MDGSVQIAIGKVYLKEEGTDMNSFDSFVANERRLNGLEYAERLANRTPEQVAFDQRNTNRYRFKESFVEQYLVNKEWELIELANKCRVDIHSGPLYNRFINNDALNHLKRLSKYCADGSIKTVEDLQKLSRSGLSSVYIQPLYEKEFGQGLFPKALIFEKWFKGRRKLKKEELEDPYMTTYLCFKGISAMGSEPAKGLAVLELLEGLELPKEVVHASIVRALILHEGVHKSFVKSPEISKLAYTLIKLGFDPYKEEFEFGGLSFEKYCGKNPPFSVPEDYKKSGLSDTILQMHAVLKEQKELSEIVALGQSKRIKRPSSSKKNTIIGRL